MKKLALISLPVAVLGVLICVAITFQSIGMSQGLDVGDRALREYQLEKGENIIDFGVAIENSYDYVGRRYLWQSMLFGIVAAAIIFQLRARDWVSTYAALGTVCLSCLLIVYIASKLISDKGMVEGSFYDDPRNAFLRQTITFDWLLIGIAIVLSALQMPTIFSSLRRRTVR